MKRMRTISVPLVVFVLSACRSSSPPSLVTKPAAPTAVVIDLSTTSIDWGSELFSTTGLQSGTRVFRAKREKVEDAILATLSEFSINNPTRADFDASISRRALRQLGAAADPPPDMFLSGFSGEDASGHRVVVELRPKMDQYAVVVHVDPSNSTASSSVILDKIGARLATSGEERITSRTSAP